jgi:hypothetical protein
MVDSPGNNFIIFIAPKRKNCGASVYVQSDQKENISEQALQSIGHVVAESYANKRSVHGRGQFVVSIMELFVHFVIII